MSAIIVVELTPRVAPPPPKRLTLADLDTITQEYLQVEEALRARKIEQAEAGCSWEESHLKSIRNKKERRRQKKHIAQCKDLVEATRSIVQQPELELHVGSIGHIERAEILQIIDSTEMHVELQEQVAGETQRVPPTRFLTISPSRTALPSDYPPTQRKPRGRNVEIVPIARLSLKNVETDGLVDGQILAPSNPLKIIGTKQYTTVLGATVTIFVAEPMEVDMDAIHRWVREHPEP